MLINPSDLNCSFEHFFEYFLDFLEYVLLCMKVLSRGCKFQILKPLLLNLIMPEELADEA